MSSQFLTDTVLKLFGGWYQHLHQSRVWRLSRGRGGLLNSLSLFLSPAQYFRRLVIRLIRQHGFEQRWIEVRYIVTDDGLGWTFAFRFTF